MKYLVTGAAGFVGTEVRKQLRLAGHDVVAVVRGTHASMDWHGDDVWTFDVRDADAVSGCVRRTAPDRIIHLAAESIVGASEASPTACMETNILGTQHVCESASRHGVPCVVATSDKAYGYHDGATGEDAPLRPTGVYETSKACADLIARMNGAVVARCCNVYGPGDMNRSRLVPRTCKRLCEGNPPEVHAGAWEYIREWIYISDAAAAYIALAVHGLPGVAYNIPGTSASVGEVATQLADIHGHGLLPKEGPGVTYYEIPQQALTVGNMATIPWKLKRKDLRNNLKRALDWYEMRHSEAARGLRCAS